MSKPLKLAVGQTRGYFSRSNPNNGTNKPRRGKISALENKATGAWVTLVDKDTSKPVTVRPTQVVA